MLRLLGFKRKQTDFDQSLKLCYQIERNLERKLVLLDNLLERHLAY